MTGRSDIRRHDGKVALVMGAALGIGAACAERLGAEGASVVVADINLPEAERTAARIVAAGGTAAAIAYDQCDERSVIELVQQAARTFGAVDGLHANAAAVDLGRSGDDRLVIEMSSELWENSFRANVTNHAVATREALPYMLGRGRGSIVYTSSDWGMVPLPYLPAYTASKAALSTLARHVCLSHGRAGVRANIVSPGHIVTEATAAFVREEKERHGVNEVGAVNCPRLGKPDDVAALVAFLLSDEAEYINGQTISINGGAYRHA